MNTHSPLWYWDCMNIEYKFEKIFLKPAELIKLISISKASFYRLLNKWTAKGVDPKLFGKVRINGSVLWNGPIFLKFLNDHEVNQEPIYEYDKADQQLAIKVINNYVKEQH